MASFTSEQLTQIKSNNMDLYVSLLESKVQSLTNEVQGYSQLLLASTSTSTPLPSSHLTSATSQPTDTPLAQLAQYDETYIATLKQQFETHIQSLETQIHTLEEYRFAAQQQHHAALHNHEIQQQQVLQQAEYECDLLLTTNHQLNQLINTLRSYLYRLSFTTSRLLSTMKALEHINNSILQLEQELMHISYRAQAAQVTQQSLINNPASQTHADGSSNTNSAVLTTESDSNLHIPNTQNITSSTTYQQSSNEEKNFSSTPIHSQQYNETQTYYFKKHNEIADQLRQLRSHQQSTFQTQAQSIEEISHIIMLIVQHQTTGVQLQQLGFNDDLNQNPITFPTDTPFQPQFNPFSQQSSNQLLTTTTSPVNEKTDLNDTHDINTNGNSSNTQQPTTFTSMLTSFFTGMFVAQNTTEDEQQIAIAGKPSEGIIKRSSADEITPDQSRLEYIRRRKSQLSQSHQYQTQRAQSQARRDQVMEDQKREIERATSTSNHNSPNTSQSQQNTETLLNSSTASANNSATVDGQDSVLLQSQNTTFDEDDGDDGDSHSSSQESSTGEVDFEATLAKILDTVGPTALYSYISPEVANDLYFKHNLEKLRQGSGKTLSVEEHNHLMDLTTKVIMDSLNRSFGAGSVSDDIFDILDVLDPEINEITSKDGVKGEILLLQRIPSTSSKIPNESILTPKPIKKPYQHHIEAVPINPLLEIATDDAFSVTRSATSVDAMESASNSHLTPSKKVVKRLQKAKQKLLDEHSSHPLTQSPNDPMKQKDTAQIDPSKLLSSSAHHRHQHHHHTIDLEMEFGNDDHSTLHQQLIAKQHANNLNFSNSNIFSLNPLYSSQYDDGVDSLHSKKFKKSHNKLSYDDSDITTSQYENNPIDDNTVNGSDNLTISQPFNYPLTPLPISLPVSTPVERPQLPVSDISLHSPSTAFASINISEDIFKEINTNSMEFKLHLKMLEQQDVRKKHDYERRFVKTLGTEVVDNFLQGQVAYRDEFLDKINQLKEQLGPEGKIFDDPVYLRSVFQDKFRVDLDDQLSQKLRDTLFRVLSSDKCDDNVKEQAVFILQRKLALRHDLDGRLHPYAVQNPLDYSSKFANNKAFDEMDRVAEQRELRLRKRAAFELKQKHDQGKGVVHTIFDFVKHTWRQ